MPQPPLAHGERPPDLRAERLGAVGFEGIGGLFADDPNHLVFDPSLLDDPGDPA